jgi:hypothetical protein
MGAKTVDVGGTPVRVVGPANYCNVDNNNPVDAAVVAQLSAMNPSHVTLTMYIDCAELNGIRSGTRQYMTRYFSVGTTRNALHQNLAGQEAAIIKGTCGDYSFERGLGESLETRRQRLRAFAEGSDIVGSEQLGALKQTPDSCYTGYVVKNKIDATIVKTVILIAFTFIKGKLIVLNTSAGYTGPGVLDAMLAEQVAYAARLRDANLY